MKRHVSISIVVIILGFVGCVWGLFGLFYALRDIPVSSVDTIDVSLWPCARRHEIEILANGLMIDWGAPKCRLIKMEKLTLFGDPRPIVIGARSDGVMVWGYEDPATKTVVPCQILSP